MGDWQIESHLQALAHRGVVVVDPRQTWVGPEVAPERVSAGAVLHPGTRLSGATTYVAPNAVIGREGPATVVDTFVGAGCEIASGYVEGAVLLDGARLGGNAHVRAGTLLEEQASTAHCVGLKHTILMSFVTLGSLINFCDVLMSGGTSRRDHSEVGSGFIHFNFTPWGRSGDKATPSLVGDVVRGVFLRQPRIFLGGSGGLVGPGQVGFGAITAAGQVVRDPVPAGRLVAVPPPARDRPVTPGHLDRAEPRTTRNLAYLGQLVALRTWYERVRWARIPDDPALEHVRVGVAAARRVIDLCIAERVERLRAFLEERGLPPPRVRLEVDSPCPLPAAPTMPYVDHLSWVRALDDDAVRAGQAWLEQVAAQAVQGP